MDDIYKTKAQLIGELHDLRGQIDILKSSEALFRQAVLSISDHIYISEVAAQTATIINRYISPHAELLTGYPLENFTTDWNFWPSQVIHPQDQTVAAVQAQRLAQGENSEVEYRLIRADGRIIWVRDSGKVHIDPHSQTRTIYGVVSDITPRKQLEAQLATIYQLGQELTLLRKETDIFKRVLETTSRLLNLKKAGYALVNPDNGYLTYHNQFVDNQWININHHAPPHACDNVDLTTIESKQAVHLIMPTSNGHDNIINEGKRALLCVPMKVGTQVIGILRLERDKSSTFSMKEQQLLQTLANQAAAAVENARLYREIGQRVEELVSMNMIGQAITSTLNLPETLTIITDHAVRLFNAMSASVALYDKGSDQLYFAAASGAKADFVLGKKLAIGQGIAGWVVHYNEPALVPDTTKDARFSPAMDRQSDFSTESILCFPLQTKSGPIGAIEIINKRNGPFNQTDMRLIGWLAMPAVNAIENARLYEAQRIAREQAEVLRDATSMLTSVLDPSQVLERILIHLERVVPFDTACVFLKENQSLRVVAGRGRHITKKQGIDPIQHSLDDALYQRIEQSKQPVILPDARLDNHFLAWGNGRGAIRGWMGVPLVVRNEVIGYVTLNSHQVNAYSENDAHLAQAFANQAAVAIENARLFEQVSIGRRRLQFLAHRLVEIQEKERRYVARELHDEAGQALASLKVKIRLLEKDLDNPEAISQHLVELKQTTDSVSENLHRLAMDLHPATLDHLGLIPALRHYVETFGKQHGLILHFETVGLDEKRLPHPVEINIYRIIQEALANIARHAHATHASVLIERRGASIITIAEDNGSGFNPDDATRTGSRLGLLSMRERAEMMNGVFEIESSPDIGTTIYVEIPYVNQNSHR
ncbi:MAG: GAF domain-containing protein [Anaerolineae bacterium]|nr:GAF domain-containing protein [Anaerolineae bacterium]